MSAPRVTRRRFLTLGGGTAVLLIAGCGAESSDPVSAPGEPTGLILPEPTTTPTETLRTSPRNEPSDDRVLVVVQLLGGNDALNALIPADGRYRDARQTLAIPEADTLTLAGNTEFSLHPSLAPLMPHWDTGDLAMVAGVAFEAQTRSHFQSRDVWWRAVDDAAAPGWLARWISAAAIDGPDDPLEAIALGVGARALAGSSAAAVNDPSDFRLAPPQGMSDADFEQYLLEVSVGAPGDPDLLAAARTAFPAALSIQKILDDLGDDSAGDAYIDRYEPPIAVQLQTAASLISTRPGLRVVTVGIDGFDTHAGQLDRQSDLLGQTAAALAGFWDVLDPDDRARTLVMTTSEFGRRVAENGSGGTDHGTAGMQFLMGGGVNGGQVGGTYGLDALVDGDLPRTVQEEEVFADALRWLGGPVQEVLGVDPPATGLVNW